MKIDDRSEKIRKIAQSISVTCGVIAVIRIITVFGLPDIEDKLIVYLIGGGTFASGIVAGYWIKEQLIGKVVYGILTSMISLPVIALTVVLSSFFLLV